MTKVRILGRRREVARLVEELQRLGLVEIADARAGEAVHALDGEETRSARREQLRLLATQVESLLGTGPAAPAGAPLSAELEHLAPQVEALDRRAQALRD